MRFNFREFLYFADFALLNKLRTQWCLNILFILILNLIQKFSSNVRESNFGACDMSVVANGSFCFSSEALE